MLFNSTSYLFFLIIVFSFYWLVRNRKFRIFLLLTSSLYFYASWKPVYLILIIITALTSYFGSLLIYKGKYKKTIFISTLFINLLILFIFKYLGFFSITLNEILKITKINFTLPEFKLLLPIGISFYTFQSIGYLIDVYKNKIKPENNIFIFLLFVTFFPQLVAGPIERSNNLLPQFKKTKKLNYHKISTGLKLISLGLFKKIVIADNLSLLVNQVYNNLDEYRGLSLLIATVCFGIQIWGDFSGYTDIARGSAKLLGFDLIKNFKNPYFATSITDFWRRWHISLSTWFKDYIYINLGGNRKGLLRTCFNLFFIFFLCGLWHGASMNFVIWGMYFGLIISIEKIIFYLIKKYNLKIKIPFLIKNFYANILVLFGWAYLGQKNYKTQFTFTKICS